MSSDMRSQKGTYNTGFVSAPLAYCTFQITVQDPVSYIQGTERTSMTVFIPFDSKVYTSENTVIWVLFTFESTEKPYSNEWREIFLSISSQIIEQAVKSHQACSKKRNIL